MQYTLERSQETVDFRFQEFASYTAKLIDEDGKEFVVGFLLVPVDQEKTILMEAAHNAPRMKLRIGFLGAA